MRSDTTREPPSPLRNGGARLDDARTERSAFERDLRDAVGDETLQLRYRPCRHDLAATPATSGRQHVAGGYEAVVVWEHPLRGRVAPEEFWPIAEATSLVIPLGEWVLWQVCLTAARWLSRHGVAVEMSIPVSAQQLTAPSFLATVADALETTEIDPSSLRFVVTGSVALEDCERVETLFAAVRALGLGVELDAGDRRIERRADRQDLVDADGVIAHYFDRRT